MNLISVETNSFCNIMYDSETGVEYIVVGNGDSIAITPRLNSDGSVRISSEFKKENKISVTCYGETKEFASKDEATAYFYEALTCCEGSEKELYADILCDLNSGKTNIKY